MLSKFNKYSRDLIIYRSVRIKNKSCKFSLKPLCFANTTKNIIPGEVTLHRLTWQRVWLLSPQEESDTVVNLTWRPDGKLLAVCYETSKLVCLVDIENKNIIHKTKMTLHNAITCMMWLPLTSMENGATLNNAKTNMQPTGEYLPPLPSLNRSFGQEPERKEFLSQNLDILFVSLDVLNTLIL